MKILNLNNKIVNQKSNNKVNSITSFRGESTTKQVNTNDYMYNYRKNMGLIIGAGVGFLAPFLAIPAKYTMTNNLEKLKVPALIMLGTALVGGFVGRVIGGLYDLNALAEEQLKNKSNTKTDVAKKS